MPKISEFFGISIYINYQEHLPPHFHVKYGEYRASIAIENLSIIVGKLTPRATGLVMEWAILHREELMCEWNKAVAHEKPNNIEPLK